MIKKLLINNIGKFADRVEEFPNTKQEFDRPVIIITGSNAAGKTTLVNAIRACASDNIDPMQLGDRDKKMYISKASKNKKSAGATLFYHDNESATWEVGAGLKRTAPITPPAISGIISPIELTTKNERHNFWNELLATDMDWDEVIIEFEKEIRLLSPKYKEKVLTYVAKIRDDNLNAEKDWDDFAQKSKEKATEYKIQSSKGFVTEHVSSKNARTLLHEVNKTPLPKDIHVKLQACQDALENNLKILKQPNSVDPKPYVDKVTNAKADAETKEELYNKLLKQLNPKIKTLNEKLTPIRTKALTLRNKYEDLKKKNMPDEDNHDILICAYCNKENVYIDGRLAKIGQQVSKKTIEQRQDEVQKALDNYNKTAKQANEIKQEITKHKDTIAETKSGVASAKTALEIYQKQLSEVEKNNDAPQYDREKVAEEIKKLNEQITNYRADIQKADASRNARKAILRALTWETLDKVCNNKGYRATKRGAAIERFNSNLSKLHEKCECPFPAPVLNESDLTFRLGKDKDEISMKLASGAEYWMCKALVQITLLLLNDNQKQMVMVFDEADILGTSKDVAEAFWYLVTRIPKLNPHVSIVVSATDFTGEYQDDALRRAKVNQLQIVELGNE